MSIENFGRVLISYINIYKKQNYLNDLKNIASQFKDDEVTIDQFVSFFIFLDFLQEALKQKLINEKNKCAPNSMHRTGTIINKDNKYVKEFIDILQCLKI